MGKLPEAQISPFLLTLNQYGDTKDLDYADLQRKLESTKSSNQSLRPITPSDEELLPRTLEGQAQTPFALFILPLYNTIRFFGYIDFKVTFDLNEQKFVYIPGGRFQKIRSFVLCILTTLFLYVDCEYQQHVKKQSGLTSLMALLKMTQVCYLTLSVSFFYILNTRGHLFPEILNRMQRVTAVLERDGCGVPRRASCTIFSRAMITATMSFQAVFVLEPFVGAWLRGKSPGVIEGGADNLVKSLAVSVTGLGIQVPPEWLTYKIYEEQPYWAVGAVAGIKFLFHYLFVCVWVLCILLFVFWALAFIQIFKSFIGVLANRPSRNTLQDIRKFNLITSMLDKFNQVVGPLTLMACVTCISHFSIYIQYLVDSEIWWLGKVTVAIGLTFFGGMLVVCSNVNREASKIIEVIKTRFQDTQVWKNYHGTCAETTQGLLLLLAEIQTNSIGFKGLTFFTITYSFIGTVLSVISTYALVVLQIKTTSASTD